MPGYELIGKEEKEAIIELFEQSGVLFAHGFDKQRGGTYKVREFEKRVADHFGCKFVQAVTSGTAALHVALKALGVGPGDEVITSSFTFVATVEAILATGATPVLTEIDKSLNMDPDDFDARITAKTKVVIPVHMAGTACDMERITSIARKKRIGVLEDAAQASGSTYRGKYLGTIGDVGIFSLDFAKNFTCGEGGLILTDNEHLYQEARCFHDHGHEYNQTIPRGKDTRHGPGFNYRMTEMHATVAIIQLAKLDHIVRTQRKNKADIKNGLKSLNLNYRTVLNPDEESGDTLVFSLPSKDLALKLASRLYEHNLGTKNLPDAIDWHFAGTWRHMQREICGNQDLTVMWPRSRDILERSIALPVNVKMDDEEKSRVIKVIREYMG